MDNIKIKKLIKKIPIHPLFFILFLWFLINNNLLSFLSFSLVLLSHELGHYVVAKNLGYKLDSFYIAPYGVSLNYKEKSFDSKDEIMIALAGPMVNIFEVIIIVMFWWVFPESYGLTFHIVTQALMLGLFNLLPCYPLDGGRILCGVLSRDMARKKAVKIAMILNYFFSFLIVLMFVVSCFYNANPSLLASAIFLVLGNLDIRNESQYKPIVFMKKTRKNFSKPFFVYVDSNCSIAELLRHIEINKFTIFVVKFDDERVKMLDENLIAKLSLSHSINEKISEIFD